MGIQNRGKNMILQKMILPDKDLTRELFVRGGNIKDNRIIINKGEKVRFDTYFNIFSAYKWDKYTEVNKIQIRVVSKGCGIALLCGINRGDSKNSVISKIKLNSQTMCETVFKELKLSESYDFLYLVVKSLQDYLIIDSFCYEDVTVEPRDIKIACCFCTYKREKEIIENVNGLKDGIIYNSKSNLYKKLHVYISDNGHTLKQDDFDCSKVHVFDNKNYGGSAGFTRCLIESVINSKYDFTHAILMDDDALIKPDIVERTALFVSVLKNKYVGKMIGGALFSKDDKFKQIENGAYYDLKNGCVNPLGFNKNMTQLRNIIDNDYDNNINYNGWFYCCIPSSFVKKDNLPLPMFIHGDDIEYGMRNKVGFINLNGICIWHPEPAKSGRLYMTYYDYRARKIIFCRNGCYSSIFSSIIRDVGSCVVMALTYNYDDLLYQYRALEDFYKGIDAFKTRDAELNNSQIINGKKYKTCHIENIENKKFWRPLNRGRYESLIHLIINVVLPSYKERIYSFDSGEAWKNVDFWGAKKVYYVDQRTGDGIVFERDDFKLIKSLLYIPKIVILLIKYHQKRYFEWNRRIKELQTEEFWNSYLL